MTKREQVSEEERKDDSVRENRLVRKREKVSEEERTGK